MKCNKCNKPGHFARDCRVRLVKQVEIMSEESVEPESEDADSDKSEHTNPEIGVEHLTFDTTDLYFPPVEDSASIMAISLDIEQGLDIEVVKADASLPQRWDPSKKLGHVVDARLLSSKPDRGKAYTAGESRFTTVLYEGKPVQILLDSGAECSIVSKKLMDRLNPKWEDDMLPISGIKFKSCSSPLEEMGIIETDLIFPHLKESVKIRPEFVVCRKANIDHFILGNEYFKMYGIDINNSKGTFFTIGGDNQKKKFLFDRGLVKYKLTTREKLAEAAHQADDGDLDLESVLSDTDCIQKIFKKDKQHATDADLESIHFSEAKVGKLLDPGQVEQLKDLCFKFKDCFATEDQPLSLIKGHEFDIELTADQPYPPALRKPPYPLSPRGKEALTTLLDSLLKLAVIRKVEPNEEVDITTAVVIAWHNGKPRLVGDFRALNSYSTVFRYPMPRIWQALVNIKEANYITGMDCLKGFHQEAASPRARRLLRIICHLGVFEYLRMPFGVKNAPAYFQFMMDQEFGQFIREGWLIVYIDDIIVATKEWEEHLTKLTLVFKKLL